jgi:DNA polymerase-3 subunit beta
MDLHITRDQLTVGLARVQGIVEQRATHPQLGHAFLQAKGNQLQIVATDSTIQLTADYEARVDAEGIASTTAGVFFQVLKSLAAPVVRLRTVGNKLKVTAGSAEFNLNTLPAEDFPHMPKVASKASLSVSGGAFKRMIEETAFCISKDDNRYGLNGAHLEETHGSGGDQRLRLVTTDGSRLAWSETPFEGVFAMGARMLLPRKVLQEMKKLIEKDDDVWQVGFGDRAAVFTGPGLSFQSRLMDGDFPDYRQVVPAAFRRRLEVERDAFSSALRRTSIMASDRNRSVRFSFEPERLVVSAQNLDAGDAREEIPAELSGEPIQTGFNVAYFQDVLGATRSDRVRLELSEPLDPCILRLPERDDCLFVVMPMRLD